MRRCLLLGLPCLIGCGGQQKGVVADVLREVFASRALDLIIDSALWCAAGVMFGVVAALVAFFAIRSAGGYGWEWAHAKWFRALTCILTVLALGFTFGAAGVAEGALRGGETVLRKSQLATDVFPLVTDACADTLAYLYLATPKLLAGGEDFADEQARLTAFQAGEWELNVAELYEQTDRLTDAAAEQGISEIKDKLYATLQLTGSGTADRLLDKALLYLAKALLTREAKKATKGLGVDRLVGELLDGLPAAAKAKGDPDTISRKELSDYLTQKGVVPALLLPLKHFVRGQQITMVLAALGVLIVPVILFRLAEWIRRRRAAAAEAEPRAAPADPADAAENAGAAAESDDAAPDAGDAAE